MSISVVERARRRRTAPDQKPAGKSKAARQAKLAAAAVDDDAAVPDRQMRGAAAEQDLTPLEIAHDMKTSVATVYSFIRAGSLPAMRLLHGYRIERRDYRLFREALKTRAPLPRRGGRRS